VFLSVPNPDGDSFAASAFNKTEEWEPKLTTLRKEEYASVFEESKLSSSALFVASYST